MARVQIQMPMAAVDASRMREAFAMFDTDGSGRLSVDEVRAILTRGPDGLSNEELQGLLQDFDAGVSHELEYEEFVVAWSRDSSPVQLRR